MEDLGESGPSATCSRHSPMAQWICSETPLIHVYRDPEVELLRVLCVVLCTM